MMAANAKVRWVWLCGAAAVVVIVVASLIPAKLQLRTGLPWQVEHFLVYFAATSIFCLASPRPFVVADRLWRLRRCSRPARFDAGSRA